MGQLVSYLAVVTATRACALIGTDAMEQSALRSGQNVAVRRVVLATTSDVLRRPVGNGMPDGQLLVTLAVPR